MKGLGEHMKLDDLKTAWKKEIYQPSRTEDLPMSAIMNDVANIDRAIRFRDFWMILALALGTLLYAIFGWLAQKQVDSLSRLGVLTFIAATTVMTVALLRARRVSQSDDWTLHSRIEIEIERLEKQRRLMNHVGYWLLLPMLISIVLSSLGGYHGRTGSYVPNTTLWAYYVCATIGYGATYWLVRREVKKKWEPLLLRLCRLRADLLGEAGASVNGKQP